RYLAATYYRLGKNEEALEELRDALKRWPDELSLKEQMTRVLETLTRMRDQSGTVTASAHEIAGGSRAILTEMNELVQITQRIKESMDEMGAGTSEINKAIAAVVSLTQENREGIGAVGSEIERFKVSEGS
ncbi:MAG TPA: tetratricopeptide repeat protein, partial [Treponemataceae bacterium]|nr:tetratricopeptide repeat protein [Treponemataceae bacterium]